MAVDQFRHQSVQRAATGGHELQDVFAVSFSVESPLNGFDLALYAPNA